MGRAGSHTGHKPLGPTWQPQPVLGGPEQTSVHPSYLCRDAGMKQMELPSSSAAQHPAHPNGIAATPASALKTGHSPNPQCGSPSPSPEMLRDALPR